MLLVALVLFILFHFTFGLVFEVFLSCLFQGYLGVLVRDVIEPFILQLLDLLADLIPFEVVSVVFFGVLADYYVPVLGVELDVVPELQVQNVRKSLHEADPVVLTEFGAAYHYHEYH